MTSDIDYYRSAHFSETIIGVDTGGARKSYPEQP